MIKEVNIYVTNLSFLVERLFPQYGALLLPVRYSPLWYNFFVILSEAKDTINHSLLIPDHSRS